MKETITQEQYREYAKTGQLPASEKKLPPMPRKPLRNLRLAAKGRNLPGHRKREMNSTERKYRDTVLAEKMEAGAVIHHEFEAVTLTLAKNTRWTPDFMLMYADGLIEFVDVKGSRPDDEQAQRVKIKLAAERFWMFRFVVEKQQTKKLGGGFTREEF